MIVIGMTFAVASADASSDQVVTSGHTPEEIVAKWEQYKPTFAGDPFLVKPNVTAPYTTGKLDPKYLQDGVKMANFVRFLRLLGLLPEPSPRWPLIMEMLGRLA